MASSGFGTDDVLRLREKLNEGRELDREDRERLVAILDAVSAGARAASGIQPTTLTDAEIGKEELRDLLAHLQPGGQSRFGANFDGEMGPELVRAVECIDIAVIGGGEQAFPSLLGALAGGDGLDAVPGLARRQDGRVVVTPALPPAVRLDDLPAPDYDEYFQRAEELGILPPAGPRTVWLPIETAGGCWWGAKHHCTFCGLNGTAMSFRPKSPERVLGELAQQVDPARHRVTQLERAAPHRPGGPTAVDAPDAQVVRAAEQVTSPANGRA